MSLNLETWSRLAASYVGSTGPRLLYANAGMFEGIDLEEKTVLDIGGGIGLAATYTLARGAKRATLLEPEGAGSSDVIDHAHALRDDLGVSDKLTILTTTFQEFDGAGAPFDVAVLEASINHLDEDAVIDILNSKDARARYIGLINDLGSLLKPGSTIVVTDCGRRNFFGDLGIRNPVAPSIEWHKHQQPKVWVELFEECGFSNPKVRWGKHTTLGRFGRYLLGNALAFYFLSSYFILTMRYDGPPAR